MDVTAVSCRTKVKGKGKGRVFAIALRTRETHDQKRFTISEVAADWHELMIPRRIMRPSIARASEQLDPRCSTQTNRRPINQPTFTPWDVARKLLLISRPAKGRRLR